MLNVFFASRLRLGVVVCVVIPIRQSQTTLYYLRNDLCRVFKILTGAKAKDSRNAVRVQAGNFIFQAEQVVDLGYSLEFRLEWFDSFDFDRLFVHARTVEVRDLLFVTIGESLFHQQAVQYGVQDILVLLVEQFESSPT